MQTEGLVEFIPEEDSDYANEFEVRIPPLDDLINEFEMGDEVLLKNQNEIIETFYD